MALNFTALFLCVAIAYLGKTCAEGNELESLKRELMEMKTLLRQNQEAQILQNEHSANYAKLFRKEIQSLKDNVNLLQRECLSDKNSKRLLDPQSVTHQLEVEVQKLKGSIAALQHEMTQGQTPIRGFTANLKTDILNLTDNQIIIFDNVITDIGNDYNPLTGGFNCEIPGMYVFYVNTLAEPGKHVETQLLKNTHALAVTYAYDKEFFSSGSKMAVVDLQKGDTVLVRTYGHEHDSAGAILDYKYTSFSGFLVKAK